MARAKVWLEDMALWDVGLDVTVGQDVTLGVSYYGGRLSVTTWGGKTTIHGRLVGIEWHEKIDDGYGPGVAMESTTDPLPEAAEDADYAFELTVATRDWLPHD